MPGSGFRLGSVGPRGLQVLLPSYRFYRQLAVLTKMLHMQSSATETACGTCLTALDRSRRCDLVCSMDGSARSAQSPSLSRGPTRSGPRPRPHIPNTSADSGTRLVRAKEFQPAHEKAAKSSACISSPMLLPERRGAPGPDFCPDFCPGLAPATHLDPDHCA